MFGKEKNTEKNEKRIEAQQPLGVSRLYAICRRQAERLTVLEANASTLRRDLNRVQGLVYRERANKGLPTSAEELGKLVENKLDHQSGNGDNDFSRALGMRG